MILKLLQYDFIGYNHRAWLKYVLALKDPASMLLFRS